MMNEQQIETVLRELPVRKPSAALGERVLAALGQHGVEDQHKIADGATLTVPLPAREGDGGSYRFPLFRHAAGLALAACIGIVIGLPLGLLVDSVRGGNSREATSPGNELATANGNDARAGAAEPVVPLQVTPALPRFSDHRVEVIFNEVEPAGRLDYLDGPPIQALHHRALQHVVLFDPEQNVQVEMTTPREDVIFVRETPY